MKKTNEVPYKIYLEEHEMPTAWYNLRADMKNKPAPLLNPGTKQPITAGELGAVFCEELVKQELDNDTAYFPIPEEVFNFYKMYRPSPLVRAYCLEKAREDLLQIRGQQHKRLAQAEFRDRAGVLREKAGPQGRHDGNGRRPVGNGSFDGLLLPRTRLQGLHGKGFLRAEAVPPGSYADIRSKGHPFSIRYNQCRTGNPEAVPRYNRKPGMRHFRGRRGCNNSGRLPLRAWKRSCPGTSAPVSNRT